MTIEQRLELSYFKTIAELNHEHEVFLVQHTETHKIYVKKILRIFNLDVYRFLMDHPIQGIPKIFLLSVENGVLTIIEEYISGNTLEEFLAASGPMPEAQVGRYTAELLTILKQLHQAKPAIIHRDIKPSNIIITPKNHVMLIDLNASRPNIRKNEDTKLLGTKGYAAPEQYGFGSSDTRADLYAVGMVMNTMLWGRFEQTIFPNSKYTVLIRNCTQMNPKDRYRSASKLLSVIGSPYDEYSTAKESWRRFLPPGFRKGIFIHTVAAIWGYIEIFVFAFSLFHADKLTKAGNILAGIMILFMQLAMIFVSANYLNVQRIMPLCRSENVIIRYLGVLIMDAGLFILFIILTTLLVFFTGMHTL